MQNRSGRYRQSVKVGRERAWCGLQCGLHSEPRSERDTPKGPHAVTEALNRRRRRSRQAIVAHVLRLRSLNGNAPPGSLSPCPFAPSFDRRIWQESVERPVTLGAHENRSQSSLSVAGLANRFLPATKAMPKKCCRSSTGPLFSTSLTRPEKLALNILSLLLGATKTSLRIISTAKSSSRLHSVIARRSEVIEVLTRELPPPGTTSFTRQQEPLGLGHAVRCARELVGNEPFAVLLPDVLIQHTPGCLAQMIKAAGDSFEDDANIIAVEGASFERDPLANVRRRRHWRAARAKLFRDNRNGRKAGS